MKKLKRFISILVAVSLCAGLFMAAIAEDNTPFFQCASWMPEDVDISSVREENGRLVGVVKLPATDWRDLTTAELRIDCPMPTGFTDEQRVTLHVVHKQISKQALSDMMKAIGQNPSGGELWAYNLGAETVVSYDCEPNIDSGYFWHQLCDVRVSADAALEKEYAQAKDVARNLVEKFGGRVWQSIYHANRRDAAHNDPYSTTSTSTEAEDSRKRRMHFEEVEAEYGRAECNFTMVRGLFELYGLPVMDQFYYQSGGDWIGASSEFRAAVRDDGALCFFQISGLPEVVSKEIIELPAFDWRVLLKQAVAKLCVSNAIGEDFQEKDRVVYAGYSVITDLKPCWVGLTADTLVPGWYCVTEQRVRKDDSVSAILSQYGDAQTLMWLAE